MTNSGDAAEQIVRMSLEGTEVALKLTGSAAKNIAAALYAVLKNRDKTKSKGHQRLSAMLKSGKELKVFTISEEHLKQFAAEAKRYGVVYCALRGKEPSTDGLVDIMVRAEDASKINRIVERFKLSTVDVGSVTPKKEKTRDEERANANPFATETEKSPPSEPTSRKPDKVAEGAIDHAEERPSVREDLRKIQQQRPQETTMPKREEFIKPEKSITPTTVAHKPPQGKKKRKQKVR